MSKLKLTLREERNFLATDNAALRLRLAEAERANERNAEECVQQAKRAAIAENALAEAKARLAELELSYDAVCKELCRTADYDALAAEVATLRLLLDAEQRHSQIMRSRLADTKTLLERIIYQPREACGGGMCDYDFCAVCGNPEHEAHQSDCAYAALLTADSADQREFEA